MAGIIYIICPAGVITGGIELLHQLCYKLSLLGYKARMLYASEEKHEAGWQYEIPWVYEKYHVQQESQIKDIEDNYVIFPEVFLNLIPQIRNCRKIVWWLSVDGAQGSEEDFEYVWNEESLIHMVQSEYARMYVREHQIPEKRIFWLSDYINSEFLHLKKVPDEEREDVILFNPNKGFEKTSELIHHATGKVMWKALAHLTPMQMRTAMQHAKVYIDFGHHPGRDRIPREAVLCGCCLVTNREGAAKNAVDIPIDERYKYDKDAPAKEVMKDVERLVHDFGTEHGKYQAYYERTVREFISFEVDTMNVFGEIAGEKREKLPLEALKEKMLESLGKRDFQAAFPYLVQMHASDEYSEDDLELAIIESNIRYGLGEYNEAEYIAKRALQKNPDNYELLLLLGGIHIKMEQLEELMDAKEECIRAAALSKGTEDEAAVSDMALRYLQEIKQIMQQHSATIYKEK